MDIKKPKTEFVVTIEGAFPELPSGKMYQTGRGTGGSKKSAFAAAGRDLFKQKGLKARRITMFKATVSIGTRVVGESS
jgi:hypothetical protein